MIYDKAKAGRMLRILLEVTTGAMDLATRPGGEPSLRTPALNAERTMRTLAAKGDVDGMYHEYLRLLDDGTGFGRSLDRLHHKSFESEFYRLVTTYWEKE
jgi:hypothetical protein